MRGVFCYVNCGDYPNSVLGSRFAFLSFLKSGRTLHSGNPEDEQTINPALRKIPRYDQDNDPPNPDGMPYMQIQKGEIVSGGLT